MWTSPAIYLWTIRYRNDVTTTVLLEVFTQRNFVADFSSPEFKFYCPKTAKSRFAPPFGRLMGNLHGLSMARWKACGRLPINANWTFLLALMVKALWADVCWNCNVRKGVCYFERVRKLESLGNHVEQRNPTFSRFDRGRWKWRTRKCRTWKWRTKRRGMKMQDLKLKDLLRLRRAFVSRHAQTWKTTIVGRVTPWSKKQSHPNFFVFLGHLHRATQDYMIYRQRVDNWLPIRRPRKKQWRTTLACRSAVWSMTTASTHTCMQFLRAVSHSIVHVQPLQIPDHSSDESDPADNDVDDDADTDQATPSHADGVESVPASADTCNSCEVCLLQPREGVALVQCGHSRFCGSCADTVASLDRGCPICRTPIRLRHRLFA